MGKYYDVQDVKENGRKMVYHYPRDRKPAHNGRLVMLLDRDIREIAVDVTNQEEYDEFYKQYREGWWLKFDLYEYEP